MADTIFRFTNSSDTVGGLASTEKIIFNSGSVPDSTGRLVQNGFRMVSDLNPHPNPDTRLNPIQDSLLGVMEVTVTGYFIDHDKTKGPINLFNWSVEDDVNSNFRFGRFGLILSTMNGLLDVTPTVGLNGTGYMLAEIDIIDVEDPRDKIAFVARFLRNGSISTVPLPA